MTTRGAVEYPCSRRLSQGRVKARRYLMATGLHFVYCVLKRYQLTCVMTQAIDDRIAALSEKLRARKGKPEYAENVKAIRAEIDRLEKANKLDDFLAEEHSRGDNS